MIAIVYYSTIHSYEWIVLFCAVILGRYYTDQHDVDEDNRAIPSYGERWCGIIYAGMCVRHVNTNPINASEFVASVCRHSRIIRMRTMSTRICRLLSAVVRIGATPLMQVSHNKVRTILHPLQFLLLLPKNNIPPPI